MRKITKSKISVGKWDSIMRKVENENLQKKMNEKKKK